MLPRRGLFFKINFIKKKLGQLRVCSRHMLVSLSLIFLVVVPLAKNSVLLQGVGLVILYITLVILRLM